MSPEQDDISFFAETNSRRVFTPFGIRQADRLQHMYVIGKTGVGKTKLLEILIRGDLRAGRGFAVIDPHGELVEQLWERASEAERERITYLNAPDSRQPFGYNPVRRVRDDRIPLAASGVLETFRKLWPTAWGVRMEHVLRNTLYALLEREGSSLPDILRLYADKNFRKAVVRGIRNPVVKQFWLSEFENYPARLRAEAVAPIQNKLGALLADPTMHRILVEPLVDIRFRTLMDQGRALFVNLAKGRLGEDASSVLGGLLVTTIGLAGFSRADSPAGGRRPFFLYVDEFQAFTTLVFANMTSELRKYGIGLILAHQHLSQLEPEIRDAVIGNVGTLVAVRTRALDARVIAAELAPTFSPLDLTTLPNRALYLKLMIDGEPGKAFSGRTLQVGASDPRGGAPTSCA